MIVNNAGLAGHAIAGSSQNLTVSNSVLTLTLPTQQVRFVMIACFTNAIIVTEDDSTPSATSGVVLNAGDTAWCFEPSRVKLLRSTGSDGAAHVVYYS